MATEGGPGALGLVRRRHVPDAVEAAWRKDLGRWVGELRRSYLQLWPDRPPEGTDVYARSRRRPFPQCWYQHDGLVEYLVALKVWQEALLDGPGGLEAARSWCEWDSFVVNTLAVQVQIVAEVCSFGHKGGLYADLAASSHTEPASSSANGSAASER